MLRIDPEDPLPPVHQVVKQLIHDILLGVLPRGTRLPTVRQLAADLGLANGTVAKAYQHLEQTGYLVTKGRKGTFVEATQATIDREEAQKQVSEKANQLALTAALTGIPEDRVREEVERALKIYGQTKIDGD